jgi:hypothetical protein
MSAAADQKRIWNRINRVQERILRHQGRFIKLLDRALRANIREMERVARNSYSLRGAGRAPTFNDRIWKRADPEGYRLYQQAKKALALK